MATTADTMAYLLANDPCVPELSKARLTKLVYLTDWVHAIRENRQVTDIHWRFDNYGPFVWDVADTAAAEPDRFIVETANTYFGNPKEVIRLRNPEREQTLGRSTLDDSEREAADHVIRETSRMNWDQFIKLVYSTHPIMSSKRYTDLDLVAKARDYLLVSR